MSQSIATNEAGKKTLLLGNEAIARGALESGVQFAAAYPGTPSSEILETLASVSREEGIHTEWSTNEMVAAEAAAAAAWAGLRAIVSMKQNGLSVILDFLMNLSYTGSGKGGLVIVVADDPGAHSSTNEQDTRPLARYTELPLLEPANHQEAKDIVAYAFGISEKYNLPVIIRETTRLGHSRGVVLLGEMQRLQRRASFDRENKFYTLPTPQKLHEKLHGKHASIMEEFENSDWNTYEGPSTPKTLMISSGIASAYAHEAVKALNLKDTGILKLATLFPIPKRLVSHHINKAAEVLFIEEIEPYLEETIRSGITDIRDGKPTYKGKLTGELPAWGELNPDLVISALAQMKGISYQPAGAGFAGETEEAAKMVPPRSIYFCPGCPHLGSYWSIMQAIRRNHNKGFVLGDIGCYTLGVFYHDVLKSVHSMGAGVGLASGFGQLSKYGLDEPVIAVIGDSTFFHAGIPALINILYNNANATVCILDNAATAMTGFQPHPGTGSNAQGEEAPHVSIEALVRGIGFNDVKVVDPYDLRSGTKVVYDAITSPGKHVIIFKRECILLTRRHLEGIDKSTTLYEVDEAKCPGEQCGVCVVQLACPACVWDPATGKAKIDEFLCNGCGLCMSLCPYKAIHLVGE